MAAGTSDLVRLILTFDCAPEFAEEVQPTLLEMAGDVRGRLTRSDYEFTGDRDSEGRRYMRKLRHRTLRKRG